jgi:hypothetical protein
LNTSANFGTGKSDVPGKKEPGKKCDWKYNQKRCNVRANGNDIQINNLLVENEIIKNKVQRNIEHGVEPSGRRIPECFKGNQMLKRSIEIINCLYDYSSHVICHIRHKSD